MGKAHKHPPGKTASSTKLENSNNTKPVNSPNNTHKSQPKNIQKVSSSTKDLIKHMSMKAVLFLILCMAIRVIYTHSYEAALEHKQTKAQKPEVDTEAPMRVHDDNPTLCGQAGYTVVLPPTVFIGVLVRNKAHVLPYFLHGLEIQDYLTKRIQLLFLADNSIDDSVNVLSQWIDSVRERYHLVNLEIGGDYLAHSKMWSTEHYEHVALLRQRLLNAARKSWADFYLTIDADVILMNPDTLKHLIESAQNPGKISSEFSDPLPAISPLMNCTSSEFYSNFWGAMTETGYYARSDTYFDIQRRSVIGLFEVPMVHSIILVNLRHKLSENLRYYPPPFGYKGPLDDLIIFARSAQLSHVPFYLDNREFYGYLPAPVDESDVFGPGSPTEQWLRREVELFVHLRLEVLIDQENSMRVLPSEALKDVAENYLPPRSKLGFDEVYYINLLRRKDRRDKMEYFLDQLGIDARHVAAVDGMLLTSENITKLGIKQLPGYADPYHKRALKFGEIGCFLSHYRLWREMEDRGYERIMILEDDVRFAPGFVRNLAGVLSEADTIKPDWELIYIGRKRMSKHEKRVPGTSKLAFPDYTYWTLGYLLKRSGARKLLAQDPLRRMVAVDEYLPIMFDRHPQKAWLEQFKPRNLVALSAEPLLVEPQRYTGEKHYVSDTEDSEVLPDK
ncbi:hypothetical protein T265_02091 [Opisthorchis viverrini]|uniref:Glycosyl transferase family 25 domain-containing protein n=2 Tax=Opisthorchis viverrini TaxID=6198 RepID=A0A075A0F4_OPIVI|nr:hypothetical protein T265_02091 [Opisthorchis viverrini]KER31722.1 hypothetical protein T265_02091 [Opisthorchis viverrini]